MKRFFYILTMLFLGVVQNSRAMEEPTESHEVPMVNCEVPFGDNEFPDEIPVGEEAYYTTLLYNGNVSYHYVPDPENPHVLKRVPYVTLDHVYNQSSPQQHQISAAPAKFFQLNNNMRNFSRRSEYWAARDFAVKRYLEVYNQLDDYDKAQFAREDEELHELAMKHVAWENRPPLGARIKESFRSLGQGLSSWWHRPSFHDNPEKEQFEQLAPRNEYQHATAEQAQHANFHDYDNARAEQQQRISGNKEKESENITDETSQELATESQNLLKEQKETTVTVVIDVSPDEPATTSHQTTSATEKKSEQNSSIFPQEKPKEQGESKQQGIPKELQEKYEEYKEYEKKIKENNQTTKSEDTQKVPNSVSSGDVAIPKEPMIDIIRQDSKEFMAKLNLPPRTNNAPSATTAYPAATTLPTSAFNTINYPTPASSSNSPTSSSLYAQRQQLNNQINHAERNESSTVKTWGGSQERRKLEAERGRVNAQIRQQESVSNYSGGGSYSNKHSRFPGYINMNAPNYFSVENKKRIKHLLKNDLICEKDKKLINNSWNEAKKNHKSPDLICQNPLDADTTNYRSTTHGKVLSVCSEIAIPIYERQSNWEKEELLPILRDNNFELANKLISKNKNKDEWLAIRRRLERHHSMPYFKKKVINEIELKSNEEFKKLWFYQQSYTKYKQIKKKIGREVKDTVLDKISQKKHVALLEKKEENAKLAGKKIYYESRKKQFQKELELEQLKIRLDIMTTIISSKSKLFQRSLFNQENFLNTQLGDFHYSNTYPLEIDVVVEPEQRIQTNENAIFLQKEIPALGQEQKRYQQAALSKITDIPATDLITTGRSSPLLPDPELIVELIADPTTPENIVALLKQSQSLQSNTASKKLVDLSTTVTELILYANTISKKIAEKNFECEQQELQHYNAIKNQLFELAESIGDYLAIVIEEAGKTGKETYEHCSFIAQHPIETIKIGAQVTGHITLKLAQLMILMEPFFDNDSFGISERQMSDIEKSAEKFVHVLSKVENKVIAFHQKSYQEQFRSGVKFGFDLAAQHLFVKCFSQLKTAIKAQKRRLFMLPVATKTIEEAAILESVKKLVTGEQQLVNKLEGIFKPNLTMPEMETRRAFIIGEQEVADAARKFSVSDYGKKVGTILQKRKVKRTKVAKTEQPIGNVSCTREFFQQKLAWFELIYDKSVIQEAISILNLQYDNILFKSKDPIWALEFTVKTLKKANSNPRWKGFRFDPSEGRKCKFKNVKEARAGIACEEQGLLSELIRESTGKSEFIDKFGKLWDVKTPTSYALDGTKIFNTQKGVKAFTEKLRKDILKDINEHFIIDLTHLCKSDHLVLYDILKQLPVDGLKRMIIVDATNPRNSKTTRALLKFLGY